MRESNHHTGCFRYRAHPCLQVERRVQRCDGNARLKQLTSSLDRLRGMRLTCAMEYPGRYRKRDIAFINPPLMVTASKDALIVQALNPRGRILLPAVKTVLQPLATDVSDSDGVLSCRIGTQQTEHIIEEERSKTAGAVPLLRQILSLFRHDDESVLGLYGVMGYDIAFQFDPIALQLPRDAQQRDLQFYLPDEVLQVDPDTDAGTLYQYDFIVSDSSGHLETTGGLRRETTLQPAAMKTTGPEVVAKLENDHTADAYQNVVKSALHEIAQGNLFEAVPSRTFKQSLRKQPSAVFQQLLTENPSPYMTLMNLGEGEFLISASPEMFVRVSAKRVESCPISGTIKRGQTPMEDAEQIRRLLNSHKDEVELTMCTDVDRNDKNRVCEAGSVRLLGRRQIETYARLIHTVDHVEGQLRDDLDGLDALMSHCWAVTVTGAPKRAAMSFIEQHEKSARGLYGGCFGFLSANGDVDTGLTIRSVHVVDGEASVRAGATLLAHSSPEEEEAETRLKASALLSALTPAEMDDKGRVDPLETVTRQTGPQDLAMMPDRFNGRVLVVDHEDSFIHSLSAAFRASGMAVETRRPASARAALQRVDYDLVVMSPGPGTPDDFACHDTLALCELKGVPVFGVCLGMQAMVTYCGGELSVLPRPVHGAASPVCHQGDDLFQGIESIFQAARYHSLVASQVPEALAVTSRTLAESIAMSVRHRTLPWVAVQFHPESVLSGSSDVMADGNRFARQLVSNLLASLQVQEVTAYRDRLSGEFPRQSGAIRQGAA